MLLLLKILERTANKLFDQANTLSKQGQYDEALEYYHKVIDYEPLNSRAYNNIGCTLSTIGRYEEALDYYNKAIEIDQSDYWFYFNKANTLSKLGRYEEALESYSEVQTITAESDLLSLMNDEEISKMQEVIKQVLEKNPTHKIATKLKAMIK